MKILIIPLILLTLCSCGRNNSRLIADQQFKDSVALADGNKVLGEITFGISKEEFYAAPLAHPHKRGSMIGDVYIQCAPALFTAEDKLYEVTFVSNVLEDEPNPFTHVLKKKFGLETSPNVWVVGDRTIKIIIRHHPFYTDERPHSYKKEEIKDHHAYPIYVLQISSNALTNIKEAENAEESRRRQEEYGAQQEQECISSN